ncbi:MAG TPA: hypothetical protein VKV80_06655 [Streptosporangiaceae bacterium]|nr:hypothetical protein [Streptosporangiaceae bacterium]
MTMTKPSTMSCQGAERPGTVTVVQGVPAVAGQQERELAELVA